MTAFQAYLTNPKTRATLSRSPRDPGFSLIELVVVVAVLAILAAIAIPAFTSINDKAAVAAAQNTLVQIVKECAVKKANNEATVFNVPKINQYTIDPADGNCGGSAGDTSTQTNGTTTTTTTTGVGNIRARRNSGAPAVLPTEIAITQTGDKTCAAGTGADASKFCDGGKW